MTCRNCHHIDLSRREMVKQGFANCKLCDKWVYYPPTHICEKFKQKEKK